jgi:hypothetical protein
LGQKEKKYDVSSTWLYKKMESQKNEKSEKREKREGAFSSSRPLLSLRPMVHTH